MPELAFIFFVGSFLVFCAVNFNLYWTIRSFKQKKLITLQNNLFKVKKYWSVERAEIIDVEVGKSLESYQEMDLKKSKLSAFVFGTILIFLSWLGLFFFLVYFLSANKFTKSRQEIGLFGSNLVTKDLNPEEVIKIYEMLAL